MFGDKKLFKRSVKLIILRFGLYVSNTRFTEFLYICIEYYSSKTLEWVNTRELDKELFTK